MDTLNVFAATATSELSIRYPGPDEELLFECALLPFVVLSSVQHGRPGLFLDQLLSGSLLYHNMHARCYPGLWRP